jgi:hypothetical protein
LRGLAARDLLADLLPAPRPIVAQTLVSVQQRGPG